MKLQIGLGEISIDTCQVRSEGSTIFTAVEIIVFCITL
jgi:hypothetical protein